MNGTPIATTGWTASSIGFSVPGDQPDTGAAWPAGTTTVQLVVSVMGQTSNSVPFGVTA
jgi:hypothetical protein